MFVVSHFEEYFMALLLKKSIMGNALQRVFMALLSSGKKNPFFLLLFKLKQGGKQNE
jgi:hypothetical protein